MAETLPNGSVVPDADGGERISTTGVAEMRTLGASVDAQLGNRAPLVHTHAWGAITGKPDAFPPAAHNHDDRYYTESETDQKLTGKVGTTDPRLTDSRPPLAHQHPVTDVSGLQAALDAKVSEGELDARLAGIASAYDVAVGEGFDGTIEQWLESLVGPRGPEGPYGGTEVTDPQVASYVTGDTETREALDASYRRSVSVLEYGATGDGETDDTAAVQAALTDNPGANVHLPPGHYRLTSNLSVPSGTTISGTDSASTLLDWSDKGEYGGFLLEWEKGTLGEPVALTSDTSFGDGTLSVEGGHGFEVGDFVRITADEVLYTEMVKAEFQRVLGVEDESVDLSGPVFDTYSTDKGARVQKVDLATGGLRGVTVRGQGVNSDGYGDSVARFALAADVQVSDVSFMDVEHKCIQLDSVLGAVVTDTRFRFDPSRTPLQYGVAIQGASQMITVSDCYSWNDRHMVTTATSQSLADHSPENRGIPRVITITGCTAHGSWQAPIDTHRGGEYVTVTGCSLTTESTGIKFRGKQSIATGNVIVGQTSSVTGAPYGVRVGMLCEDIQITANIIKGFDDGVRVDTPDGATREITISDNMIIDCTRPVGIHGATPLAGIRVAGNTLRALDEGHPVYIIAEVHGLEITGNTILGGTQGIFMAHPSRPVTRLMIQGNTLRGQAVRAMFLRNVTDGAVIGNFAEQDMRFSGAHTRVKAAANHGPLTDLSDNGIDRGDSGWKSLSAGSGITASSNYAWRDKNGVAYFRGSVTSEWASGWTTITSGLTDAAPVSEIRVEPVGAPKGYLVRITTSGALELYAPTAGNLSAHLNALVYPLD